MRELEYPEETESILSGGVQQVLRDGEIVVNETHYTSPTGVHGAFENILSPMRGPDGEVAFVVGSTRDITQRHETEQALRRANAELQRFAYVASHDLKAPLRAVHGLSSWIEEEVAGHLSEEGRERLELLRERVRLMDDLINGMLDYARAGTRVGELEEVSVADLITEVVKAHGLPEGFRVSLAENLPHLRTDRLHLRQVFANLIGNAIEHHDRADGHVWISVRDRGAFHEFSVADDGPGIPPEYRGRLFEMFQRGPDRKAGTGVGLAVVRRIVERVGGQVWLDSSPGQGATFRFTWPKRLRPDLGVEESSSV